MTSEVLKNEVEQLMQSFLNTNQHCFASYLFQQYLFSGHLGRLKSYPLVNIGTTQWLPLSMCRRLVQNAGTVGLLKDYITPYTFAIRIKINIIILNSFQTLLRYFKVFVHLGFAKSLFTLLHLSPPSHWPKSPPQKLCDVGCCDNKLPVETPHQDHIIREF